jgi:hypothetical protein
MGSELAIREPSRGYAGPQWKRRYVRAIENRPSWNIESE